MLRFSDKKYAFMMLNSAVGHKPDENIQRIWRKASFRVATDGAANTLYDFNKTLTNGTPPLIPEIINGDFDSAQNHVLEYFQEKGTNIVPTPDQDETDFTKGLRLLVAEIKNDFPQQVSGIFVLDSFSGRPDHIFGNINTLYMAVGMTDIPVYLYSGSSISCLIQKGVTTMMTPDRTDQWCGLIPVGGAANQVKTSGLKWNLDNEKMAFGCLVSTSNRLDGSGSVTIETDSELLWIMGLDPVR